MCRTKPRIPSRYTKLVSMPKAKKKQFSAVKEVKALAREQVGQVKSSRVETPKRKRRPKYPEPAEET